MRELNNGTHKAIITTMGVELFNLNTKERINLGISIPKKVREKVVDIIFNRN